MIREQKIRKMVQYLQAATKDMNLPMVDKLIAQYGKDPYMILVACLLSLRARDTVTYGIAKKLFSYAKTPQEMVALPLSELETIIKSAGFYKRKAETIKHVSQEIISRFGGKVPSNLKDLLSIKGIGLKTAGLVLGEVFGVPALCVDTHVHQISNKLGLVHTKTADQTERALQKIVPKDLWIEFSRLLVQYGQNNGNLASLQKIIGNKS